MNWEGTGKELGIFIISIHFVKNNECQKYLNQFSKTNLIPKLLCRYDLKLIVIHKRFVRRPYQTTFSSIRRIKKMLKGDFHSYEEKLQPIYKNMGQDIVKQSKRLCGDIIIAQVVFSRDQRE